MFEVVTVDTGLGLDPGLCAVLLEVTALSFGTELLVHGQIRIARVEFAVG